MGRRAGGVPRISTLSDWEMREALVQYAAGWTVREIASWAGVNVHTMDKWLVRCKRYVREGRAA